MVKENTCFKSIENPSCVDLFLTNCNKSFQTTEVISTGISDCHKMILTVLKMTFKKAKPKENVYRSYKNCDRNVLCNDLRNKLDDCQNYTKFESVCLEVLNTVCTFKEKTSLCK